MVVGFHLKNRLKTTASIRVGNGEHGKVAIGTFYQTMQRFVELPFRWDSIKIV